MNSRTQSNISRKSAAISNAPNRVLLYARKSTESEDRQVQSIDDQIRLCEEIAQKEGFVVVRTIAEARSAKAPGKRTGFRQMLDALESGQANGILTWHPDRLARNAVDGGWILDMLDRGVLTHLVFASSYTFENTPEGKFMLNMIFSQAKYYVDKLSKDVLRGMTTKREKGHFPHRAPEGYLNNVIDKIIEADPERYPLLRQAIELILQQALLPAQVLERINKDWGYRTRKTKRSGGGPLSHTSFYDMLSNPFYYGLCQEKDLTYPGSHPPLMSEKEFDQIQVILGKPERPMAQKHSFTLTGLIRCGRCGCMITATRAKGHVYYHCTNSKGVCDRKGVREEELLEQATTLLDSLTIPEFVKEAVLDAVQRFVHETFGKETEVTQNAHRAIEEGQRQMQLLMSMRMRDLLTDAEFLEQKARLQKEIAHLQVKASQSGTEIENVIQIAEDALSYAANARRAFDEGTTEERRRIIEMLGTKYVLTGKKLLLEVHPYLRLFQDGQGEIRGFKPSENGSGKSKKTVSDETVLHGWASGIAVELVAVIRGLQEPYFRLPARS